jgi:hypothetical protein
LRKLKAWLWIEDTFIEEDYNQWLIYMKKEGYTFRDNPTFEEYAKKMLTGILDQIVEQPNYYIQVQDFDKAKPEPKTYDWEEEEKRLGDL